jgi:hypothetical protein
MTRTMLDAVDYTAIPQGTPLVAGYVDGPRSQWPAEAWDAFPGSIMVRIAVLPTTNDGMVLDVEPGDARPSDVTSWLTMRRAAGIDPTVYCSPANITIIAAACRAAGVAAPHYWVSRPDGDPTIPVGCVAKQYKWDATIDTSSVADYWPGVDPVPQGDEDSMADRHVVEGTQDIDILNKVAAAALGPLAAGNQSQGVTAYVRYGPSVDLPIGLQELIIRVPFGTFPAGLGS